MEVLLIIYSGTERSTTWLTMALALFYLGQAECPRVPGAAATRPFMGWSSELSVAVAQGTETLLNFNLLSCHAASAVAHEMGHF